MELFVLLLAFASERICLSSPSWAFGCVSKVWLDSVWQGRSRSSSRKVCIDFTTVLRLEAASMRRWRGQRWASGVLGLCVRPGRSGRDCFSFVNQKSIRQSRPSYSDACHQGFIVALLMQNSVSPPTTQNDLHSKFICMFRFNERIELGPSMQGGGGRRRLTHSFDRSLSWAWSERVCAVQEVNVMLIFATLHSLVHIFRPPVKLPAPAPSTYYGWRAFWIK